MNQSNRSYNKTLFVWDEKKRQANLLKHRLDFADAALVYENATKITLTSERHGESRHADTAVIQVSNTCLTLVYVERSPAIRVISFRAASRRERQLFARARQQD